MIYNFPKYLILTCLDLYGKFVEFKYKFKQLYYFSIYHKLSNHTKIGLKAVTLKHNCYCFRNIWIMDYNKICSHSISLNSDFSSALWSMIALSAGTDDIVVQSDVPPEGDSGVTRVVRERKKLIDLKADELKPLKIII